MKEIRLFFSLKQVPFSQNLRPEELFELPGLLPMQKRIDFALNLRNFTLVTGEVGSGKSTSLRYITHHLPRGAHEILFFTAGRYGMIEFYRQLLLCFGVVSSSYKSSIMLKEVQDHLREIHARHVLPVLIIDEAHLLKEEIFGQLHILSQDTFDSNPLLPTILCGQDSLIDKLMSPSARPLASRILGRSHLEAIRKEVMFDYISHHLRIAGTEEKIFSDEALTAIHQGSGGLLRKANNLCRASMLAAAFEKNKVVSADHVRTAMTELI
jgi:type II secretory pathway predicted ATPase ExeA